MLDSNLTEVCTLWQVPPNETVDVLIRTPFPGCVRVSEVAFDAKPGRKLFVLGILGPVVQRQGLATSCRELFKPGDDRRIRFSSPFSRKLGDEHKPALTLDQGV